MKYKVSVINIGNELLLGRTVNTNLSWLGTSLSNLGLPICRSVTIQDSYSDIIQTLTSEWENNDIVLVTGGLGPTLDDITKNVIADFFGKKLEFREDIWMHIKELFSKRNLIVPDINTSQAMVPQDFQTLTNANGTAPGLYYKEGNKTFIALPGVPNEMKSIYNDQIKTILTNSYVISPIMISEIHTWNISESALAERLKDIVIPEDIQLAWLPQTGRVDLRIYGTNLDLLKRTRTGILNLINDCVWGFDDDTPQAVLMDLLIEKNCDIAVVESCTGGMVQELITNTPGASKVFKGGLVAYDNNVKARQLNVKQETLYKHGAVSKETAEEMACGIRDIISSKIGLSITGIAGPDGGTIAKPLGLVYIGVSIKDVVYVKEVIFNGERNTVRFKAAEYSILYATKLIKEIL